MDTRIIGLQSFIEQLIFFTLISGFYFLHKFQYSQYLIENLQLFKMIQDCPEFEKATQMFYSMQYEEGLTLINQCIRNDPQNSILYSNRALFYSQIGFMQEAFQDLNTSLSLNYLNYISYFNLFSLLMRCDKIDEGFQNLCCSMSCLYLVRAKTKKSELDASKAIKYAQNNMEAHVLKGLIHLQNGKYKLALNQLDWACQISPTHEVTRKIRNLIIKKMNPGLPIENEDTLTHSEMWAHKLYRLQSSYSLDENDKQKELRDKVLEFNQIYNNLNEYQGTVTTKVPKQESGEEIGDHGSHGLQKYKINGQTKQYLPQINQNVAQQITQIPTDYEPMCKQKLKDALQNILDCSKYINQSNTNNGTNQQNSINIQPLEYKIQILEKANNLSLNHQIVDSEGNQYLNGSILHQNQTRKSRQQNHDFNSCQEFCVPDDGAATPSITSYAPEPGQYGTSLSSDHQLLQMSLDKNVQSQFRSMSVKEVSQNSDFHSMINSHKNENQEFCEQSFDSFISESNQLQNQSFSMISNRLYPIIQNSLLQISIMKLEILDRSEEQISEMKNIYCIANYLNVNGNQQNFKLRTACQKGYNNGTEWNQTFDPIVIPESPECMKIKVYDKKYSSYRDDLIGQMEVQISTHGLVKLPLFNKKGDLAGSLFMNLQLVFCPIKEVEQADSN